MTDLPMYTPNGTRCHQRRSFLVTSLVFGILGLCLVVRLYNLMLYKSEQYAVLATSQQERSRKIKAKRGLIIDRNGCILADNKAVCTISVIHSQLKDKDLVIKELSTLLNMDRETVKKRVEKVSLREIIKVNVDKETADIIRRKNLPGVKVDEDFRRYYPYSTLASRVLGFTGSDNQGILGLESFYEKELTGSAGYIRTLTTATGIEVEGVPERRISPTSGKNLHVSLDVNVMLYAQQQAKRVYLEKQAKKVQILIMNPKNGEIYACVNYPEYDLNDPFSIPLELKDAYTGTEMEKLNKMWRNGIIQDTYEPGSTFKVITAAAGLESNVVTRSDHFYCPGYFVVADRRIRCHKTNGHGSEDFFLAVRNSCNPVFIQVGLRIGVNRFFTYLEKFCILEKTGVDFPGEAKTIMHAKENVGEVELATMSFGQSFQLTPLRLATTISALINGGHMITPHFGMYIEDEDNARFVQLTYETKSDMITKKTSEDLKEVLESVVSLGGGSNAYIPGYKIGGKTATSEKLPRSAHRYIASFIGFAPSDDPEVLVLLTIDEPVGIYYGGTIAAPAVRSIFENILPYFGIEKEAGVFSQNVDAIKIIKE